MPYDGNGIPPIGKITGVQMYLPNADMIRRVSVVEVVTAKDLDSRKLGVTDINYGCETCDGSWEYCPGHSGHINLHIPCYKIFFVKRLIDIGNCICIYCHRLRLPKNDPSYDKIRNMAPRDRLSNLVKASKPYKICKRIDNPVTNGDDSDDDDDDDIGCDDTSGENNPSTFYCGDNGTYCNKRYVEFSNEDADAAFVKAIVTLDDTDLKNYRCDETNWKPFQLSPRDLYDTLDLLDDETKFMMGCGKWNDTNAVMWDALPVPSHNTRPCQVMSEIGKNKKKKYNEWTKLMKNITTANEKLKTCMESNFNNVNICVYSINKLESPNYKICFQYGYLSKPVRDIHQKRLKKELKQYEYNPVEDAWRILNRKIAAFHSFKHKKYLSGTVCYGAVPENIEERYKNQKKGRFRKDINSKRINNAARGVLEGSLFIQPTEVVAPKSICMNLTYKMYVSFLNMKIVHKLIQNGPYKYPGVNYIMMKNGVEIDLAYKENRRDVKVQDVLFVRRHLQNGDIVNVGRQPTLHKPSMMAFRIVVREGYVIRLHCCVFPPLGADCDGDEINMYVPQLTLAEAELRGFCGVDSMIMKDGKIVIKFILNAVTGAWLLTKDGIELNEDQVHNLTNFLPLFQYPIPHRIDPLTGERFWTGRQIVSLIIPNDFSLTLSTDEGKNKIVIKNGELLCGRLDSSALNGSSGLLNHLYRDYSDHQVTIDFLYQGYRLFQNYIDMHGMSAGYFDTAIDYCHLDKYPRSLFLQEEKDGVIVTEEDKKTLKYKIKRIYDCQDNVEKLKAYVDLFPEHTPNGDIAIESNIKIHIEKMATMMRNAVVDYQTTKSDTISNGLLQTIRSGAKGTLDIINQMCGMVGQVFVLFQRNKTCSSHFRKGENLLESFGFINGNYASGISLKGVINQSFSTCESLLNKNIATADSGSANRKMVFCCMDMVINHLGQVEDSTGKIVWDVYGNDGYNSSMLTSCKLPLIDDPIDFYGQIFLNPNHMTSACRSLWEMEDTRTKNTLQTEINELQELVQILQNVRSIAFLAPLNLNHLFQTCANLFDNKYQCQPNGKLQIPLTPAYYAKFSNMLWDMLISEKLVMKYNYKLKYYFKHWFSAKNMIAKWRFTISQLEYVVTQLKSILQRSKIQAGDAVGIDATQSLGEPFTQMVLKATHFAGRFPSAVAGTTKFVNVLSNVYKPETSTMKVVMTPEYNTEYEANLFGLSLSSCYFHNICDVYPLYQFHQDAKICSIKFIVNKEKAIDRLISLSEVVKTICLRIQDLHEHYFSYSFSTEDDWYVTLDLPMNSCVWDWFQQCDKITSKKTKEALADIIVYNLFICENIHGCKEIDNFIVEHSTLKPNLKRWTVLTLGSSLAKVSKMKQVDIEYTTSNNCQEMCSIFGLFAARKAVRNELMTVMSGRADPRHVEIIVRKLTSNLEVHGTKVKQVGKHIPPLQRVSFEQFRTQIVDVCENAEVDSIQTTCGASFTNTEVKLGTGFGLSLIPDTKMKPLPQNDKLQATKVCDYVFSPKVDGLRLYLTFFHNEKNVPCCNYVNRKQHIFTLPTSNLNFPTIFEGTILDGELIKVPNTDDYCFVIFDCLFCHGNNVAILRYDQRIEIARELVYRLGTMNLNSDFKNAKDLTPIELGISNNITKDYKLPIFNKERAKVSKNMFKAGDLPFFIAVKPSFTISGVVDFKHNIIDKGKYTFPTDGEIFTSTFLAAYPFRSVRECVYKHKPRGETYNENTIDVILTINKRFRNNDSLELCELKNFEPKQSAMFNYSKFQTNNGNILMWGVSNRHNVLFCTLYHPEKDLDKIDFGKVYECIWNHKTCLWEIMIPRTKYPNNMETIVATVQNIIEDISLEDIANCEII
jgi:DNA-directed RNA polymerase beta' subunit